MTPSPERLEQFPDLHPAFNSQSALAEANRCLFCFDAPCTAACPTHIDVPRFIKKISSGNLRGSALTILDANILGLSCSRVCPVDVLCEGSCVLHRYNQKPIEIGRLQRYAMDRFYDAQGTLPVAPSTGARRVACVGGGPASLACAAELARRGHSVTIFDNRPLPGGLNTYGVAEYKLRPCAKWNWCVRWEWSFARRTWELRSRSKNWRGISRSSSWGWDWAPWSGSASPEKKPWG